MGKNWVSELGDVKIDGGFNPTRKIVVDQISGLERTTALGRAIAAIDELAARTPGIGGPTSEVKAGANEVFWQNFGPKAIYHHWREGTYLIYGEIYKAYFVLGGAGEGTTGATLGPLTSTEMFSDMIEVRGPDGQVDQVAPRVVHFREGQISWAEAQGGIKISRTRNSTCRLRWNFELIQQRSSNDWHDNDWLCAVWTVNDMAHPMTASLRNAVNGDPEIHARPENRRGRTPIASIEDYVLCNRHDVVTVSYTVVNLSGSGYEEQARRATEITGEVLAWVGPKWLDLASVVLQTLPGTGALAATIGGLIPTYRDDVTGAVGTIWNEVGGPAVMRIVDVAETALEALGKRPNCSGLVLHDHVVFQPLQAVDTTLTKTYTAHRDTGCQTPETIVNLDMIREL